MTDRAESQHSVRTHIVTYKIHVDDQGRPEVVDMEIGPIEVTRFLDENPPAWFKRMHQAVVASLRNEWQIRGAN